MTCIILDTSASLWPARSYVRLLLELQFPIHTDLDEGAELLGHGALADLAALEGTAGLGDQEQGRGGQDDADPNYTETCHGVYECLLRQDSCSRDCGPTMTD